MKTSNFKGLRQFRAPTLALALSFMAIFGQKTSASDDLAPAPPAPRDWLASFLQDQNNALVETRENLASWEESEQREFYWSEEHNIDNTPAEEDQKKYAQKRLVRFFERKISREIRGSKNSNISSSANLLVGEEENKNLVEKREESPVKGKVKLRARILRGEGQAILEDEVVNNKIELEAFKKNLSWKVYKDFFDLGLYAETSYNILRGELNTKLKKVITKTTHTELNYEVKSGHWQTVVDQRLVDNLSMQVASEKNSPGLAKGSAQTIQLNYSAPF